MADNKGQNNPDELHMQQKKNQKQDYKKQNHNKQAKKQQLPKVVVVQVPATTANMGAGFDAFGMAFSFYNQVKMTRVGGFEGLQIKNIGETSASLADPGKNLVARVARKLWDSVNFDWNGIELNLENNVPVSRGLGSSATAIVGGLVAANVMAGKPYSNKEILEMAVDEEGHPDNVAPAFYGGFVTSCRRNGKTLMVKIKPDKSLRVVVAIPDFSLSTKIAREAMPKEVSVPDAVYNIQCASLLVGALAQGNFKLFGKAIDDRLHQPYRFPLIKGADQVLKAAMSAGALGAALSGAGPTLIAYTTTDGVRIQAAMAKAWKHLNVNCKVLILEQDHQGVQYQLEV